MANLVFICYFDHIPDCGMSPPCLGVWRPGSLMAHSGNRSLYLDTLPFESLLPAPLLPRANLRMALSGGGQPWTMSSYLEPDPKGRDVAFLDQYAGERWAGAPSLPPSLPSGGRQSSTTWWPPASREGSVLMPSGPCYRWTTNHLC